MKQEWGGKDRGMTHRGGQGPPSMNTRCYSEGREKPMKGLKKNEANYSDLCFRKIFCVRVGVGMEQGARKSALKVIAKSGWKRLSCYNKEH